MNAIQSLCQPASVGLKRFRRALSTPVDGASLAVFRICFGLVMVWHVGKYLMRGGGTSVLHLIYLDRAWHFRYPMFEWVHPWPDPLLTIHFVVVVAAALLVAAGLFYRPACAVLFFGYTYIFLLEATRYNNHYYLMCLLAFVMFWMPADRRFSITAWWRARHHPDGHVETTIPFWPIFLLRFQLFVVYFFGGIAKINRDWLTGEPIFNSGQTLHGFFDSWIGLPDFLGVMEVCLFMAWSGLVYDLLIGFLLLWRRTCWFAIAITFLFHLHNHFIFSIGVFPVMAFTATLIFLDPDWPVRGYRVIRNWLGRPVRESDAQTPTAAQTSPIRTATFALVCVFVVWQILFPLRHHFIRGDANWTEESHSFSWRMMLRSKAAGQLTYLVNDEAIHVVDQQGRPQIDWSKCSPQTPKAVFVAVDSHLFNWTHHPGLTMTYEPILGSRLVYNPLGSGSTDDEALRNSKQKVLDQWARTFDRVPLVEETLSLPEAVVELRQRIEAVGDRDPELKAVTLKAIDAVMESVEARKEGVRHESWGVAVANRLDALATFGFPEVTRSVFRRLHPYAIQGASFPRQQFLVIHDPELNSDPQAGFLKLSKSQPYVVWLDMTRLRPSDWRQLPQSFVTLESKSLRIVWNYFRDMDANQLSQFTTNPFYIRQYARHITAQWEEQTGRRPAVNVHSYIMLNYHVPQSLVDANLDVAATGYVFHRHNEWILPRVYSPIGIAKMAISPQQQHRR